MKRKSIPESERIYVVFNFCGTTKNFTLSKQIKGWIGALYKCVEIANHEVDVHNSSPYNGSKCDYIFTHILSIYARRRLNTIQFQSFLM